MDSLYSRMRMIGIALAVLSIGFGIAFLGFFLTSGK
jgi:hypothetical protein